MTATAAPPRINVPSSIASYEQETLTFTLDVSQRANVMIYRNFFW
jgi:hypothetical protein